MDKPNGTSTSAFGTNGRISHDSSRFYNSRMYKAFSLPKISDYIENPLPKNAANRIFCGSSADMHQLPDNSIHLMVTSPPYNAGKEYDEDLSLPEYLAMLKQVWQETFRVLVTGGRACINVANLGRKPYIPLHAYIIEDMLEIGFLMRGEIIWHKGTSSNSSTAWGSWMSPSNPTLRDIHEYILVFSKGAFKRVPPEEREKTVERDDFLRDTVSIWEFPPVSARKIGHPAPFPEELPSRLIELYTYQDEIVLDPFMGSGQTAIAAQNNQRRYVGYDLSPEYCQLAETRVAEAAETS